jgi:hypothetical protein
MISSVALLFGKGGTNNPVVKIARESPTLNTWLKLSIPLTVLSCSVLLAAGAGLLLLKPWARKLSIAYAIYALVMGVIASVINYMFLTLPLLEEAQRRKGPEAAGAIGGVVASAGGCVGLVYPILLLIFMTRPKVVAAFRPEKGLPEVEENFIWTDDE